MVVGGEETTGVEEAVVGGGERGVFRALWVEARERGVEESLVAGELQFSFWDMDDGFEERGKGAGEGGGGVVFEGGGGGEEGYGGWRGGGWVGFSGVFGDVGGL